MTDVTVYGGHLEGRFPVNYEQARNALERCERVDECKEWRDRAAAIASYAKQKNDRSLFETATRIRARAERRYGELFDIIREQSRLTVKATAEKLGVKANDAERSRRIARVESGTFERLVEKSPPAPISVLAKIGVDPRAEDQSGAVWLALSALVRLTQSYPIGEVRQSIANAPPDAESMKVLRKCLTVAIEYVDTIDAALTARRK